MKRMIARVLISATMMAGAMGVGKAPATSNAAECKVNGSVGLAAPLNSAPRKSTFNFIQANLVCVGSNINATYDVKASGSTTGLPPLGGAAGEDCNQGQTDVTKNGNTWSDLAYNNTLRATKISSGTGPQLMYARVTFQRISSLVLVDGVLHTTNNMSSATYATFKAQLQFTPGGRQLVGGLDVPNPSTGQLVGCSGTSGGITTAALDGEAEIVD